MGFIHGLAVFLILFEGIIIKCKCTTPVDTTSLDLIQDAPIIEIIGDQQFLPDHLIEVIISQSDFKTTQTTVRSGIINATRISMSRILRDRIIVIIPHNFDDNTHEYNEDGDLFLRFGSYRGLVSLFDQFGDLVKKIKICYYYLRGSNSHFLRKQINRNIINRYANKLEELRISANDDEGVWEEMSNEDNGIIFSEVKKFQVFGTITREEFKLNTIFPQLESFKLIGYVTDPNCLANVTKLKELELDTDSIQENQFDHIFASNRNITVISLATPKRAETMHAIAKYLTKLETLQVRFPVGNFLFRSNNMQMHNLSSVTHFHITFFRIIELIGDLSFDMPHLKKLSLKGNQIDNRIIDFINYFKELETVELLGVQLKNIKEFAVNNFEDSQLCSLRKFFERFDQESKLQTLKLFDFGGFYQRYEYTMKETNTHLAISNKPTWTLSEGEENRTGQKYLMFKRER